MVVHREPRAFAMADIAGSSRLWNRYPDRMSAALASHDSCARPAVEAAGGRLFKHTGDGFLATFADVDGALDAMVAYQRSLPLEADRTGMDLRSRVGIHFGPAEARRRGTVRADDRPARAPHRPRRTHARGALGCCGRPRRAVPGHLRPPRRVPGAPTRRTRFPSTRRGYDSAVGPALTVAAGRGLPRLPDRARRARGGRRLLALLERVQLVTVLGFGGMGKTHLAVECARRWSEGTRAPVYFADLSGGDDPDGRHLRRGRCGP